MNSYKVKKKENKTKYFVTPRGESYSTVTTWRKQNQTSTVLNLVALLSLIVLPRAWYLQYAGVTTGCTLTDSIPASIQELCHMVSNLPDPFNPGFSTDTKTASSNF